MAPPSQGLIASLSHDQQGQATAEIHDLLKGYYDGTTVTIPIDVIVGTGHRAR